MIIYAYGLEESSSAPYWMIIDTNNQEHSKLLKLEPDDERYDKWINQVKTMAILMENFRNSFYEGVTQ